MENMSTHMLWHQCVNRHGILLVMTRLDWKLETSKLPASFARPWIGATVPRLVLMRLSSSSLHDCIDRCQVERELTGWPTRQMFTLNLK
jgi:hypothetical protein